MIEVFSKASRLEWDASLLSVPEANVYYTYQYCRAFELNGDGEPVLLKYSDGKGLVGICVIMVRDIAECRYFRDFIPNDSLFDAATPYGYGGFVFNRPPSPEEQNMIADELIKTLSDLNIISLFIRFSPVLRNAADNRGIVNVTELGKTITLDLESEDRIWENFTSKNRNHIRKSKKAGVYVLHGKGDKLMKNFVSIYNQTMREDNADAYYFFKKDFYDSIINDLKDFYELFYAVYNDEIIAMSIMLFKGGQMEYHLAGSRREFRNLDGGTLLLEQAAVWGSSQGFKTFHLGGGVGSAQDALFKFKEAFNKNSNTVFSIGKLIVNAEEYDRLVKFRESSGKDFNPQSSFFPLYRS